MISDFTIVTPSFNQGKYLEKCITSVLNQKGTVTDYIVMDGGSTDNSKDVIDKYEKHLYHYEIKKDNGQADAINRGASKSSSPIIGYINSDDYYVDGALEKVKNYFENHPDIDFIVGLCQIVDHKDHLLKTYKFDGISKYEYLSPKKSIHNFIPQPSTFWRRTVWIKYGPLSLKYRNAFDYDYFLNLLLNNVKVGYINEVLAAYRVHPSQKSADTSVIFQETVQISKSNMKFIEGNEKIKKKLLIDYKWCEYRIQLNQAINKFHEVGYFKYLIEILFIGIKNPYFAFRHKLYYYLFIRPLFKS
jgi:glycosyltransferase involved in cell wall biosynthesis